MKVSFYNIGCKVNYADMSHLQELFVEKGHEIVAYGTEADIIFINTCTVTNTADSDCRKIIRKTHRKHPEAYIGVFGCYAQLKPDEIAAIDGVELVIGTKDKFDIDRIIENIQNPSSKSIINSDLVDIDFTFSSSSENKDRTRVFLKIQDGCDYKCTYCTIPLARGECRSMPFADIIPEIDKIQAKGAHEIILSGINLGEYIDNGHNFSQVVAHADAQLNDIRLRISSIEPNLLRDDIIETVSKSEVFCPHFHIPLQSGSDHILKQMKRRYNTDTFKTLILKLKKHIPDVCLGIDVIAGFPGEMDIFFEETFTFLEALPISHLHVFTYSERSNTPAADYENSVPMHIRKERTNKLRDLSEKKLKIFYMSQLGSIRTVLPESFDSERGCWTGWTENYVKAVFKGPKDLSKSFHKIQLNDYENDHVFAKLI